MFSFITQTVLVGHSYKVHVILKYVTGHKNTLFNFFKCRKQKHKQTLHLIGLYESMVDSITQSQMVRQSRFGLLGAVDQRRPLSQLFINDTA